MSGICISIVLLIVFCSIHACSLDVTFPCLEATLPVTFCLDFVL